MKYLKHSLPVGALVAMAALVVSNATPGTPMQGLPASQVWLQIGHSTPANVEAPGTCGSTGPLMACQPSTKVIYEGPLGSGTYGYFGLRTYDQDAFVANTGDVKGNSAVVNGPGTYLITGLVLNPGGGAGFASWSADYFLSVSSAQGSQPTIVPVDPITGQFSFAMPDDPLNPGHMANGASFNIHVRENQDQATGATSFPPEVVDIEFVSTTWTPSGGSAVASNVGWNRRLRWIIEDSGR